MANSRKKKNTFLDFIGAAEHLIAKGYTTSGNIVAQGRSAGGMLMGAIANMRPDLFKGILGEVPFVDVINTMSDEKLPLTPPEWVEWGDPIRDGDAFNNMASYCPYTNISDQPYPNILATGGLTDPRVTYWEPTKWAAKGAEFSGLERASLVRRPVGTALHLKYAGHDLTPTGKKRLAPSRLQRTRRGAA